MYISRIDGKLNSDMLVQRDTLINANTFLYLGRKNYSEKQLEKIRAIKEKQKKYYKQSIEVDFVYGNDSKILTN